MLQRINELMIQTLKRNSIDIEETKDIAKEYLKNIAKTSHQTVLMQSIHQIGATDPELQQTLLQLLQSC